jgi:hypothetical protein
MGECRSGKTPSFFKEVKGFENLIKEI